MLAARRQTKKNRQTDNLRMKKALRDQGRFSHRRLLGIAHTAGLFPWRTFFNSFFASKAARDFIKKLRSDIQSSKEKRFSDNFPFRRNFGEKKFGSILFLQIFGKSLKFSMKGFDWMRLDLMNWNLSSCSTNRSITPTILARSNYWGIPHLPERIMKWEQDTSYYDGFL